MKDEDRAKIEEIIAGMQCPKDFKCADAGFERLCRAKDIGLEHHLECLEADPRTCPFVVPFGHGYFCRCPLRVYLEKNLERKPGGTGADQPGTQD